MYWHHIVLDNGLQDFARQQAGGLLKWRDENSIAVLSFMARKTPVFDLFYVAENVAFPHFQMYHQQEVSYSSGQ